MDQIAYRISRGQLAAAFAGLFLAISSLLGWLIARDLTQPRVVASRQVIAGTSGSGPTAAQKSTSQTAKTGAAPGGGAPAASNAGVQSGPLKIGAVKRTAGIF